MQYMNLSDSDFDFGSDCSDFKEIPPKNSKTGHSIDHCSTTFATPDSN